MGYVIGGFSGLALAYFAGSVVLGDFMTGLIPRTAFALWMRSNRATEKTLSMPVPVQKTWTCTISWSNYLALPPGTKSGASEKVDKADYDRLKREHKHLQEDNCQPA